LQLYPFSTLSLICCMLSSESQSTSITPPATFYPYSESEVKLVPHDDIVLVISVPSDVY